MRFTIKNTRTGVTYVSIPVVWITAFTIGVVVGAIFKTVAGYLF